MIFFVIFMFLISLVYNEKNCSFYFQQAVQLAATRSMVIAKNLMSACKYLPAYSLVIIK